MAGRIGAQKSKDTGDNTYEPCKTIGTPSTTVEESNKDIFGRSMRSKIHQWDHDSEESKDMEDQNQTFNLRKPSRQKGIDEHDDEDQSIEYECSLPSGWRIAVVIKDDHSLDDGRSEEGDTGLAGLPCDYSEPSCGIT